MADADNKDTSQETTEKPVTQGTNKVEAELASVRAMLEEMNQGFAAMAAANQAQKQQTQKKVEEDIDPTYNPKGYKTQLLNEAEEIARRTIARERELNSTVYQMSQDFPEISSDAVLKKAITENLKSLPESIRDTAAGYETAILKAVHKAGILPKSRRQTTLDEDVSLGSSRSSSEGSSRNKQGKVKLSEETLLFAELLGRDVNDPKIREGLEKAAQRTKWNKYE